jgi:hypothetical protein
LTHILATSHTEKLGVAKVQSVCARARTIFRAITTDDVGVDGFIEVVEEANATGVMAGVQIKSGDSFVNDEGMRFKFVSDQAHFGYWARCSFPVIGIVFSPEHNKAVWLDLTGSATDKRIAEGSYTITVTYTEETAFTPSNLLSRIVPAIYKYTHQRRTLWQIQQLVSPRKRQRELSVPSLEVSGENDEAWYKLMEKLFSPNSSDEEIADAGYRLSWYFPTISIDLHKLLSERLAQITDFQLARIIGSIHWLLDANAESVAELIVELLRRVPEITVRIERLLRENKIPTVHREAAIQSIEFIMEEINHTLRDELNA